VRLPGQDVSSEAGNMRAVDCRLLSIRSQHAPASALVVMDK